MWSNMHRIKKTKMKHHQQSSGFGLPASGFLHNIAILGCGKVAHLHAKAVQNLKNAKLAGVWSRSENTARNFAAQYNVPFYTEIEELVRREKIDLAIVCTPHPFHLEPAEKAAAAGANILVEKPLASTLEDSDKIIEACKKADVKLGVISQMV
jgi:predicted dehydrogenase